MRGVVRRGLLVLPLALGGCTLARHVGLASEVTKQEARYQDQPNGSERCESCLYFSAPSNCTQVRGPVSPDGWCRFWRSGVF